MGRMCTQLMLVFLITCFRYNVCDGQVTIAKQSFEASGDTWSVNYNPNPYNTEDALGDNGPVDGNDDVWDNISAFTNDISSASEGSLFWGIQDLDNGNGGGNFDHTITTDWLTVSSYSSVEVSFDYYTIGFESSDDLAYQIAYDMGAFGAEVDLNDNTTAWTPVTISVPNGTTSVRLRLVARQNGADDFGGWDNVLATGVLSTPDPEPTNHPTNFITDTGTPAYSVIDMVWDDATGTQVPDGYLIKANTTGTFTDPVDGTDPTEDTDLSDGSALVKVAQGTEFYSFSGLSGSTQYFFKIWPYTNSGANIDFKTNGTPPEDNATTGVDPCGTAQALPFSEDFEGMSFPPECWTSFRGTNGLGTGEDWQLDGNGNAGSSGAAFVSYENVNGGNAEDWLVTPEISIPAGGATLSFFASDEFAANYGTTYTVRVSTGSQTTHADFSVVQTYAETDFQNTYQQYSVNLNTYAGQEVYIAFVMSQDDGDNWYIDDVAVEAPVSTTTLQFATSSEIINEGDGNYSLCVDITNPDGTNATMADIVLTSGNAVDLDNYATQTVTFPAGSSTQQCVTLTITDDSSIEGSEDIVFALANVSGGNSASAGTPDEFTLTIQDNDIPSIADIRINEVDADTPGTDSESFIELYSPGKTNFALDGLVVVLFNGNNDNSYEAYDLDGFMTDAAGFFIIGNAGAPRNPEIVETGDWLQNGADAVALYFADATDFPNGTPVTSTGLIDALVYDTNDADDSGLLSGLGQAEQINENENGNSQNESIQRGSWIVATPTPRGANQLLPVTLVDFAAKPFDSTTLLTFATATESGNSHFDIERSLDGRTFTKIGEVAGAGDSEEQIDYTFTDTKPAVGVNYYRLKQVDFAGTYEYFGPVAVRFGGKLGEQPVRVWPVPARETLQVELLGEADSEWQLQVVDLNGRTLLQRQYQDKSLNTSLPIAELPAGAYFLRWRNGPRTGQTRFVKQ